MALSRRLLSCACALAILAADGGAVASSYGPRVRAILKEYGVRYEPWEDAASEKIKTPYGVSCVETWAKHYNTFPEWGMNDCAETDNPYALKAIQELAKNYGTLYNWETRWASEVHTPEELSAFLAAIAGSHTEKDLADAALLSGWKHAHEEDHLLEEKMRRVTTYESNVRSALSHLPFSCRARLSGVTVKIVEPQGTSKPVSLAHFDGTVPPATDAKACVAPLTGTLTLYRVDKAGPGFRDSDMRDAIAKAVGCRVPKSAARRPRPRIPGLRDAVTSRPRILTHQSCVVRLPPPVVVNSSRTVIEEETRTVRTHRKTVTEEMSQHSNAPSPPEVVDAGAAHHDGPSASAEVSVSASAPNGGSATVSARVEP
ncbi:MAG TPA: hypothetical protein VNI01_16180 [Elusimicrobiota bacterium]|jgi:hypothetical protein|nr:hypothetical protein [Elusimicrobiota bacterium]